MKAYFDIEVLLKVDFRDMVNDLTINTNIF